jgi:hypothetical protein
MCQMLECLCVEKGSFLLYNEWLIGLKFMFHSLQAEYYLWFIYYISLNFAVYLGVSLYQKLMFDKLNAFRFAKY